MLRGDPLRLHRDVAGLPAKLDRLRVMVGLVTAKRSQEEKHHRAAGEEQQQPAIPWPGEVDLNLERALSRQAFSPSGQERSEQGDNRSENEKERRNDVGETA